MKKSIEIEKEIKKAYAKLETLKQEESKRIDAVMALDTFQERQEARKAAKDAMIKASKERRKLEITIRILKNNEKAAFISEYFPQVLEIYNSYAGKQYGPVTEKKIREEIKEKLNIFASISGQEVRLYKLNKEGYSYGDTLLMDTVYENGEKIKILVDNKIQKTTPENFRTYDCKPYIEDINGYIKNLDKAYERVLAAEKEIKEACSIFCGLSITGMREPYATVQNLYSDYI
jgi:hypothetical protein